jgi:tetratricopeptide (TPR) repeat protein
MKLLFHCALAAVIATGSFAGTTAALAKSSKPVDWNKKLEKGYYELSIGNVDQAIDWFRGKVKSNPSSAACHTALGTALKKKGKLQDAKNEFSAATSAEPTYANGFYELGAMQESDKEYAAASQSFEKYLQYSDDTNKKKVVEDRLKFCKEHS